MFLRSRLLIYSFCFFLITGNVEYEFIFNSVACTFVESSRHENWVDCQNLL